MCMRGITREVVKVMTLSGISFHDCMVKYLCFLCLWIKIFIDSFCKLVKFTDIFSNRVMTAAVSDSPIAASWHYPWCCDVQPGELHPQPCQICSQWLSVCVAEIFPFGIPFISQLYGHAKCNHLVPSVFQELHLTLPSWPKSTRGWPFIDWPHTLTATLG